MKSILNKSILALMLLIFVFSLVPKLKAYTPEMIQVNIEIRTPNGITHQSSIPTTRGNIISMESSDLHPEFEFVYTIINGISNTNSHITFVASNSTNVTAIYKNSDQITLTYLDTNNDIIDVIYGDKYDFHIVTPDIEPSKPGYVFLDWDIPSDITIDTIVRPIYEQISDYQVEVTINNQSHIYDYSEVVTLNPTNLNFSYWADEHGQIVSTNPNYTFSALYNRTLNEVLNISVPDTPRLYLSNVTGIRDGDISLLGYIENNELDIIEYGILASNQERVLTLSNSTKIPSQSLSPTNEYLRTFVGDTYKSFRGYAILSNNTVIYSDNNFYIKLTESFTENFNATGLTGTYSNKSFNGRSNTEWEVYQARNVFTYGINGEGILLQGIFGSYVNITFPNGVDKLSFDYRKAYTSSNARQLEILANGNVIHLTPIFGNSSGDDATIHKVNLIDLGLPNDTIITIRILGANTTPRQVVIDNFKWTEKVVPNITERLQVVRFNYLNNRVDTIVYAGDNVLEPTLPTLETHEFEGWYTDYNFIGEPFDINSPIESNIELFAKWLLIEEDETQVIYNIDFGETERKGYSNSPVMFTNTWDNLPYTLDKDRFQINELNINQVGVLAPVKENSYAYVEFDLSNLIKIVNQITFDYGTWNSRSLTALKNSNSEAIFGLEVFIDGNWILLENAESTTNLINNLTEQFQTVTYNVGGNYKYRVVLNTPGADTNTTNTGQAGIIDNFKAIHHSSGTSLNPNFITPDTHTYYAEQNKSFEPPVLYALDRYGRYIEADLISGYVLDELGEFELEYEAIDFDGLTSTYKVTLIVIEELPVGELPEMDEEKLQELKNSFATARNNLPAPLGIPYDPLTYYADLNGLTGEAFKQVLQNILEDTHVRNVTYDQARFILEQADAVQTEIGTYLHGIYSNHRIVRYWDGGTTWAREHVWPNSKLGIPRVSGSSANLGSDVHNLRVINPSVNSSRSNRYFDIGHTCTFGTIGTEAYDPGLDHRGDVARIIFYMYVRYNDLLALSSIVDEVLAGDAYTTGATTMGLLNVLIQWHNQDPVDDFEINRNNVIFSYQGNRNPFIDNPDYIARLFPEFS